MRTRDFGMGFFGREAMHNHEHGKGFGRHELTVKAMDKRCEEWMQKTPEEKEAFVKERKEMMNDFHKHVHAFFGHGRGFGHCFGEREEK